MSESDRRPEIEIFEDSEWSSDRLGPELRDAATLHRLERALVKDGRRLQYCAKIELNWLEGLRELYTRCEGSVIDQRGRSYRDFLEATKPVEAESRAGQRRARSTAAWLLDARRSDGRNQVMRWARAMNPSSPSQMRGEAIVKMQRRAFLACIGAALENGRVLAFCETGSGTMMVQPRRAAERFRRRKQALADHHFFLVSGDLPVGMEIAPTGGPLGDLEARIVDFLRVKIREARQPGQDRKEVRPYRSKRAAFAAIRQALAGDDPSNAALERAWKKVRTEAMAKPGRR